MDHVYEDNKTQALALMQELILVVPSNNSRKFPQQYNAELYKRRNEVECFFLRIERFRKVFIRYGKLDIIYFSIVTLGLIFGALFMCSRSSKSLFG